MVLPPVEKNKIIKIGKIGYQHISQQFGLPFLKLQWHLPLRCMGPHPIHGESMFPASHEKQQEELT